MNLLLDANLSWRLIQVLKPFCEDVWHVSSVKRPHPLKDTEIWDVAKQRKAIIITNDDDFYKLSILKGFPPKVVVLRTGNQSRNYLAEVLLKHISEIQSLDSSE